ncbi:MAG: DUF2520 domain-containing protein [Desulfobacteraceae bacterium]|nr:DUF2520 domain-containing protein [Desulfobacteraceae bacterium]
MKKYAIVGCGRLGTALARYMADAGYSPAGFASRGLASAKRAAAVSGSDAPVSLLPWEVTPGADIVMITTPDGAIRETAEKIAEYQGVKKDTVVLHCSGAHASTELEALRRCGAKTGSLHPLQSFAAENVEKNPFVGIMAAVEGEPEAVKTARSLAENLGAGPFEIQTDKKMLYHASAVVASNYMVTLMNLALQLIIASGVPASRGFAILKPLVQGTLSNIERAGIPGALTGPIARGDVETVRDHISEISAKAPTRLELYRLIGKHTIEIAEARGDLTGEAAGELKKLLSEPDR